MNRVIFTVIEKGTTIPSKSLSKLHEPQPYDIAYMSDQFPVYPITICMYLENPPFNKFSINFDANFYPSKGILYGS